MSGAAVIKRSTLTLVGYLGEEDLVGINWLTASTNGGIVKVFENSSDKPVIYELESIKSKITPKMKNGQISFLVKIKLNGLIIEVATDAADIRKKRI
ncbi:MAG: Ger(x)C family spore germination C-terminal domain-containing protein [Bacillota bacterium]